MNVICQFTSIQINSYHAQKDDLSTLTECKDPCMRRASCLLILVCQVEVIVSHLSVVALHPRLVVSHQALIAVH